MLKLNMVSHNHKIKIDQKTIHNTQSQFVVCSYIHIFLRWFFRKEKLDDILCHTQRDQVDGTQNSTLNWNRQPDIIWYYVRYNKTSFVIASWKNIYDCKSGQIVSFLWLYFIARKKMNRHVLLYIIIAQQPTYTSSAVYKILFFLEFVWNN